MIKSLKIKNFQSHKDSSLEFSPGVNIIVGTTDCGKTAVLRALRLAVWNKPSGDEYRSHWGGKTEVQVQTTEGDTIRRIRDTGENAYHLNETKFVAFSTDVPQEIQQCLNMSGINLQQQLDRPFLLTESPGEVAQHFNRMANLESITRARQVIERSIRSHKQTIDSDGKALKQEMIKLGEYNHLETFETRLEVLEQMETSFLTDVKRANSLDKLRADIIYNQKQTSLKTPLIALEGQVDNLLGLYGDVNSVYAEIMTLRSLVESIQKTDSDMIDLQNHISILPQVESLLVLYDQISSIDKDQDKLHRSIRAIKTTMKNIADKQTEYDLLNTEFQELLSTVCPLCERPF